MFQSGVMGLVGSLGAVSKIVLLLLFVASILSWGVIFYKWRAFKAADREDQRFFNAFTKIRDLDELYRQSKRAAAIPASPAPMTTIRRLAFMMLVLFLWPNTLVPIPCNPIANSFRNSRLFIPIFTHVI